MKINGLLMDDQDNVVTCVAEIRKGDQVVYLKDGKEETLEAKEDIPFCTRLPWWIFLRMGKWSNMENCWERPGRPSKRALGF